MVGRWEEPAVIKIHEGCGGRIRWVEAIDTPGVGYTGDCTGCLCDSVVFENMIPIVVRGEEPGFGGEFDIREAVLEKSQESLAGLEWDDRGDFEANQKRLRNVFMEDSA